MERERRGSLLSDTEAVRSWKWWIKKKGHGLADGTSLPCSGVSHSNKQLILAMMGVLFTVLNHHFVFVFAFFFCFFTKQSVIYVIIVNE